MEFQYIERSDGTHLCDDIQCRTISTIQIVIGFHDRVHLCEDHATTIGLEIRALQLQEAMK